MGIVRQLVQITATEALRDRTIAGPRVHDSLIKALPMILTDEAQPVLVVSVEDSLSMAEEGLFRTNVDMTLQLQLAIASRVTVRVPNADGEVVEFEDIDIGDSDAAFEASVNLLDRQWRVALSDPGNAWAEMFRRLVPSIGRIADVRLSDPETGRKHAARVVELTISPIAEPAPGAADTDVIEDAISLMETIADYVGVAKILRDALSKGSELFDWQKVQARLMTVAGMPAAIGVGTPDDLSEVVFDEITINIAGQIDEGG